jgi:hypothetical protein
MNNESFEALPRNYGIGRSPLWRATGENSINPPVEPQPTKKMKAISWTPGPIDTYNIRPCTSLFVNHDMSPQTGADRLIQQYTSRHGKAQVPIALRVQNVFNMLSGSPWSGQVGPFLLAASKGEHDSFFEPWYEWHDEFFQILKDWGIVVDEVMLDEEHNLSPWGINGMVPDLRAWYQEWAPQINPDFFSDYDFSGRYWGLSPDAISAFGSATNSPLDLFYRKVYVDMVQKYWGKGIPCSNYNDMYPQNDIIPTRTENKSEGNKTWSMGSSGVTEIQAPEIYFSGGGNAFGMWPKEKRWEHILMNFNNLQSMRLTNNLIRPWLPTIGYGGPASIGDMTQDQLRNEIDLMRIYLAHLGDIGVEMHYFWNWDYNTVEVDGKSLFEWMSILMDETVINPNPAPPVEIAPGLDVLDTGGVQTAYADVLHLVTK